MVISLGSARLHQWPHDLPNRDKSVRVGDARLAHYGSSVPALPVEWWLLVSRLIQSFKAPLSLPWTGHWCRAKGGPDPLEFPQKGREGVLDTSACPRHLCNRTMPLSSWQLVSALASSFSALEAATVSLWTTSWPSWCIGARMDSLPASIAIEDWLTRSFETRLTSYYARKRRGQRKSASWQSESALALSLHAQGEGTSELKLAFWSLRRMGARMDSLPARITNKDRFMRTLESRLTSCYARLGRECRGVAGFLLGMASKAIRHRQAASGRRSSDS